MTHNLLQIWHGYGSYQLVFGTNPNLPNIMTDNLPALQGAKHLQALHESHRAFIQSEADEHIRQATT